MTDRATKEEQLAFLKNEFSNVASVILTSVQGLNATQVDSLRRKLHDAGVNYRVVKNTVAKRAVEGTALSVIAHDFREVTAIAWHKTDPVAAAKAVAAFKKETDKFIIKSGFQGGNRLDLEGVKALAAIPPKDELRSILLATINGIAQKIAGTLKAKHDKDLEAQGGSSEASAEVPAEATA